MGMMPVTNEVVDDDCDENGGMIWLGEETKVENKGNLSFALSTFLFNENALSIYCKVRPTLRQSLMKT